MYADFGDRSHVSFFVEHLCRRRGVAFFMIGGGGGGAPILHPNMLFSLTN